VSEPDTSMDDWPRCPECGYATGAEAEVKRLEAKAAKWEKWARQMRFAFAGVAPWEKEGGK